MSLVVTVAAAPAVLSARTPATSVNARFMISGVADAGLLPRVLEPLAKLGLVPDRVHASREHHDAAELTVDVRLAGVSSRHAELVELALRAIVGVRRVVASVEAH